MIMKRSKLKANTNPQELPKEEIRELILRYEDMILLKLNKLKAMSWEEVRGILPWIRIFKNLGIILILKLLWLVTIKKIMGSRIKFHLPEEEQRKIYNLSYMYYLTPVFKELNGLIEEQFTICGYNYRHIYPGKKNRRNYTDLSSDEHYGRETKWWNRINKALRITKVLVWLPTVSLVYFEFLKIDISMYWLHIVTAISLPALHFFISYLCKLGEGHSSVKDRIARKVYEDIQAYLLPKEITESLLQDFNNKINKQMETPKKINIYMAKYKYGIMIIAVTSIILVCFYIFNYDYEKNIQSTAMPMEDSASMSEKELADNRDKTKIKTLTLDPVKIREMIKKEAEIMLLSESMPAAEIIFDDYVGISGKINSAEITFVLDTADIKVNVLKNTKVEVSGTIKSRIEVGSWSITKKKLSQIDPNGTLKEIYGDQLSSMILGLYLSNNEILKKYDQEKQNVEIQAKSHIEKVIHEKFSYADISTNITIQEPKLDMSNTSIVMEIAPEEPVVKPEEIQQLFKDKEMIALLNDKMPAAEIIFDDDVGIIGKVNSAEIAFLLDASSIRVSIIDSIKTNVVGDMESNINIDGWSILKKKFFDFNPDRTLREGYGDRLDDKVMGIYLSNIDVLKKYDKEKQTAEIKAKSYIEKSIKEKYPQLIISIGIEFQKSTLDTSNFIDPLY